MAYITAFGISFAVLTLFLAFKLLEQAHPIAYYTMLRKRADVFVVTALARMRQRIARVERQLSVHNVIRLSIHYVASAIAQFAHIVEVYASDITRQIARNGNGTARATKSSFLQEVSTHKEGLDTERVRRETSLTNDRDDQ